MVWKTAPTQCAYLRCSSLRAPGRRTFPRSRPRNRRNPAAVGVHDVEVRVAADARASEDERLTVRRERRVARPGGGTEMRQLPQATAVRTDCVDVAARC